MRDIEAPFELDLDGRHMRISEHELAGKRVFHISFGKSEAALVISIGMSARGEKFWTSIPEGRQKEASEIGKMIAKHIRAKRR